MKITRKIRNKITIIDCQFEFLVTKHEEYFFKFTIHNK